MSIQIALPYWRTANSADFSACKFPTYKRYVTNRFDVFGQSVIFASYALASQFPFCKTFTFSYVLGYERTLQGKLPDFQKKMEK
jgi:hypothetical protein